MEIIGNETKTEKKASLERKPEKVSSGFEPLKDGFADRSLRPLGYDTECSNDSIRKNFLNQEMEMRFA